MGKIVEFLIENGWVVTTEDEYYITYEKKDCIGIEIGCEEIVFICDSGDFLHIDINYYAFIGALFIHCPKGIKGVY